jgi:LysR family pca operon transcriptional activator
MALRLQHLMTFLAVAEARNVTQAAAALHVAQSAVSRTLRELEQALGAQLLERHSWGVSLTPAGEALAVRARAIRAEARAADREIGALVREKRALLTLGAAPTVAAWRLPLALARLRESGAEIRFRVVEGAYEVLLPKLVHGELDAVLGPLDMPLPDELAAAPLYTDELLVLVRAGHPLSGTPSEGDLAAAEWVLPQRSSELWRQLAFIFQRIGLPAPTVAIESESIGFTRSMLHLTDCVSVVPRDLFELDLRSGGLVAPQVEGLPWRRSIGIIHRQSPAVLQRLARLTAAITASPGVDEGKR